MEIEEIAKLKAEQQQHKAAALACEEKIQRFEKTKKELLAERKAKILEGGLSMEILETLNALERTDPEIVALNQQLTDLRDEKQNHAEAEFYIATQIAKILG